MSKDNAFIWRHNQHLSDWNTAPGIMRRPSAKTLQNDGRSRDPLDIGLRLCAYKYS
jgi:hypothetical protein